MGLNRAECIGNLGADPEMRFMPNGRPVTSFRVASSRRYYNAAKDLIEETEWFYIVVYGKQAESCNQYLNKGSLVYVDGRLNTRSWTDQEQKKHYRTEVIAANVQFLTKGSNVLGTPDEQAIVEGAEPEAEPAVKQEAVPPAAAKANKKVVKKAAAKEEPEAAAGEIAS